MSQPIKHSDNKQTLIRVYKHIDSFLYRFYMSVNVNSQLTEIVVFKEMHFIVDVARADSFVRTPLWLPVNVNVFDSLSIILPTYILFAPPFYKFDLIYLKYMYKMFI